MSQQTEQRPTKEPPQPFEQVAAVATANVSDNPTGFTAGQDFLHRFGYLPEDLSAADAEPRTTGVLDTKTSSALARYQSFHGLPASGLFDGPTRR